MIKEGKRHPTWLVPLLVAWSAHLAAPALASEHLHWEARDGSAIFQDRFLETAEGLQSQGIKRFSLPNATPSSRVITQLDFDGDRKQQEILVIDAIHETAEVLKLDQGQATVISSFRLPRDYVFRGLADLNGDLKDDLVFRDRDTGLIYAHFAAGSVIGLPAKVDLSRPSLREPLSVIYDPEVSDGFFESIKYLGAANMDADPIDDLIFLDSSTGAIILAQGSGGFIKERVTLTNENANNLSYLAAEDIDGDGHRDLIFLDEADWEIVVFHCKQNALLFTTREQIPGKKQIVETIKSLDTQAGTDLLMVNPKGKRWLWSYRAKAAPSSGGEAFTKKRLKPLWGTHHFTGQLSGFASGKNYLTSIDPESGKVKAWDLSSLTDPKTQELGGEDSKFLENHKQIQGWEFQQRVSEAHALSMPAMSFGNNSLVLSTVSKDGKIWWTRLYLNRTPVWKDSGLSSSTILDASYIQGQSVLAYRGLDGKAYLARLDDSSQTWRQTLLHDQRSQSSVSIAEHQGQWISSTLSPTGRLLFTKSATFEGSTPPTWSEVGYTIYDQTPKLTAGKKAIRMTLRTVAGRIRMIRSDDAGLSWKEPRSLRGPKRFGYPQRVRWGSQSRVIANTADFRSMGFHGPSEPSWLRLSALSGERISHVRKQGAQFFLSRDLGFEHRDIDISREAPALYCSLPASSPLGRFVLAYARNSQDPETICDLPNGFSLDTAQATPTSSKPTTTASSKKGR